MKQILIVVALAICCGCGIWTPESSIDERVLALADTNNPSHKICIKKMSKDHWFIYWKDKKYETQGEVFHDFELTEMSLSTNKIVRYVETMIRECDDNTIYAIPQAVPKASSK